MSGRGDTGVRAVLITAGGVTLDGDLVDRTAGGGVVVFAHGSGSSRHSPRNRHVAGVLQEAGLATLLMDLLTPEEEAEDLRTRALRFDIELLAGRLVDVIDRVATTRPEAGRPVGVFGASTGAAAALVAASRRPRAVAAAVSRGGRPDLAGDALEDVRAPTLLIVGGADAPVIELNRVALPRIGGHAELRIVDGAGHLFEEPGTLDIAAGFARDWLVHHMSGPERAQEE